jgi:hypothetical protein
VSPSPSHSHAPPARKIAAIPGIVALFALAAAIQPRLTAADTPSQHAPSSHASSPEAHSAQVIVTAAPDTVSLADFQARLHTLDQLVAQCQSAITSANCPASQVGPDIQIALPSGSRQVHFAWLRNLLDTAADSEKKSPDKAKAKPAKAGEDSEDPDTTSPPEFQPPSLAEQLADARKRLAADAQLAATWTQTSSGPSKAAPSPQRQTLDRILAQKEYHPAVAGPSLLDRAFEKIGNWIDNILGKLEQAGFRSKWVGVTAEILFVLALTIALIWFLIRLERQGRMNATQFLPGSGGAAPSARDWQLWLEDARRAATQSAWRDAIHLLYWASISRLESLGLWPADRARTPREYLALLTQENAHHADLKTLTRSFERTWYAGRPAAEADFRQAAEVAAKLGIPPNPDRGPR